MSNEFSWSLQKALYQHLSMDDALQALLGTPPRLYDHPPQGVSYPYAVLGENRVRDWPGVDGGLEHELRFYAYSRHGGRREVKQVFGALYDALHLIDLTAEDIRLVQIRFVFADIFPRAANGVYQGVARYRAVTQPL